MAFEKKPDGLWHGRYRYNGQLITACDEDIFLCIWRMGWMLNAIKGQRT